MTRGMVWLTACVSLMWVLASARRADATLVDTTNFTESTLTFVSGGNVTGIAWAPDGSNRMFVTQKGGAVRVIKDGSVLAGNFATETVYTNSECGLIGIAFDPDFVSNGHVYFFKTATANEQQIIRYTAVGDVGTNRTVLVSNLPTAGQNHDGGAVGVGPDGKLYWAIGDLGNGTGVDANLSSLAAKVGRANIDGSIPNDNPFYDGDGPNNDYIWARGFRNPFTFTWQPSTELLWLNVVGTSYEQVFVVDRGSHGGWDNYENTQPLSGYLQPIIKYRTGTTQSFTISTAVRDSDVVTSTTTTRHRLRRGEPITVASVVDTSFNGSFHVVDTPTDPNAADATWFTVTQVGSDTSSSGGTVTTLAQGNAITGGTFYDGTAFPAAYRGNFFYGDFGSNRVMRAVIEAGPAVKSVDYFSSNIGTYIDAEVGPDGALYYASNNGTVYRVTYNATQQGLILSRTHFWFSEGKQAALSVRLAVAPLADVEVNTTHSTGSTDLALNAGATLTFTPGNYATPQVIRLQAAEDADTTDDTATFTVSSNDLASETVYVRARDDDSNVTLVVSDAALNLDEGTTEQFTVSLGEMPSDDVTVNVARSLGDADVTVQTGGSLT
ncbi:MAG TPA: PQQ-dependent sugar dehydrogenase, partial [Polyangiaceae bacterium]|nr:PQQ-dependent sugar dehydrogenase [Polyangiaceae bacterium]